MCVSECGAIQQCPLLHSEHDDAVPCDLCRIYLHVDITADGWTANDTIGYSCDPLAKRKEAQSCWCRYAKIGYHQKVVVREKETRHVPAKHVFALRTTPPCPEPHLAAFQPTLAHTPYTSVSIRA